MKIISFGRPSRRGARVPAILEEVVELRKKALLIGIAYKSKGKEGMDNEVELAGPYKDVAEMKSLLMANYGYKEEDIVTLLDADYLSPDLHPTQSNLLQRIDELVAGAKPGDKFFFLYAGHGAQKPNRTNSEEDGMDECIVPCDAGSSEDGYILDNELQRRLVKPLPAGSQLTAIFDTCHSESLLDLPHYRCNRVYVPWINKGHRLSASLWNVTSRRQAMFISSRRIHQRRRVSDSIMLAKELKIDQVLTSSKSVNSDDTRSSEESVKKSRSLKPYKSVQFVTTIKSRSLTLSLDTKDLPITKPSSRGSSVANSPSNVFSPMHRCESPEADFPCDGNCRDFPLLSQASERFKDTADVVSISSCKDNQETMEGIDGETMTQIMVDFLGTDPHPTWRNLMTNLSHTMYDKMLQRHKEGREFHLTKKLWRSKLEKRGRLPPESAPTPDTNNFITPQLASPRPMDLDGRWMP